MFQAPKVCDQRKPLQCTCYPRPCRHSLILAKVCFGRELTCTPNHVIHMFHRAASMFWLRCLLHFYYRKHATSNFDPRARIGMSPQQQGVRKTTSMISLEKRPRAKPTLPRLRTGPKLSLVKKPRAPNPRLLAFVHILARQAAQEAFATTAHGKPVH